MLVVDSHMKIRFASCGVSTLLGFSMRKLATMRLDQLLPPPFNTLHSKYLRVRACVCTCAAQLTFGPDIQTAQRHLAS